MRSQLKNKTSIYFLIAMCLFLGVACSSEPTGSTSQLGGTDSVNSVSNIEPVQETHDPVDSVADELQDFVIDTVETDYMAVLEGMRDGPKVLVGAEMLLNKHLKDLEGLRVGLVANHTSQVYPGVHLVDTLLGRGIALKKVFAPEHGFRGTADAGETVKSGLDKKTGLPIISLYGKNKKPTQEQLAGLDIVLFDIQDVGTRFYTYISTMSYVMEACAEAGIRFMVLDRPNPNGWYVDGPVMKPDYQSFIGMHNIPIVHGMTIGEYATMVNEEGWLPNGVKVPLQVIPVEGYTHAMRWTETGLPWIAPSPNLATEYSAYLYPAICWFEPTPVSVGRGTDDAFTMLGAPWFRGDEFAAARSVEQGIDIYGMNILPHQFLPISLPGKSKYPKHENKMCQGMRFEGRVDGKSLFMMGIYAMRRFYSEFEVTEQEGNFFKKNFERWPGYSGFRQVIIDDVNPETVYLSWQAEVDQFREIRKNYLLYEDF